jgi:hypothetical protein
VRKEFSLSSTWIDLTPAPCPVNVCKRICFKSNPGKN